MKTVQIIGVVLALSLSVSVSAVVLRTLGQTPPTAVAAQPCEEPATPSATVATAAFASGAQIMVGGVTVTLNEIVDPYRSPDRFRQAEAGKRIVAIDVTLRSDRDEPYDWNKFRFRLQDRDGYQYQPTSIAYPGAALTSGTFAARGDTVRGWLAFEIPEGAAIRNLQYEARYGEIPGRFESE